MLFKLLKYLLPYWVFRCLKYYWPFRHEKPAVEKVSQDTSANSSTGGWSLLPVELKFLIFDFVTEPTETDMFGERGQEIQPLYTISSCAAVNKEWQAFFEKRNFKHIIVRNLKDVRKFKKIVKGRRISYVTWIWLALELPQYGCTYYALQENYLENALHRAIFANNILELFYALSHWKRHDEDGNERKGITFELSAFSRSDSEHCNMCEFAWFRNRNGWDDNVEIAVSQRSTFKSKCKTNCDRVGTRNFRSDEIRRIFGRARGLDFCWGEDVVPEVPIISRFLIRRQFPRHFRLKKGLQPILNSLTELDEFRYEPWRGLSEVTPVCAERNKEHLILFDDVFRSKMSLKKFSFFESYSVRLHMTWAKRAQPNRADPRLGQMLAKRSGHFQELNAALGVDARDFFHAFLPGADESLREDLMWNNLESISLSSLALAPEQYDELICAAAGAAMRMPQLKTMEIWNSEFRQEDRTLLIRQGFRGLYEARFRYEAWVRQGCPKIQLWTTWPACFSMEAEEVWAAVAEMHCSDRRLEKEVMRYAFQATPWDKRGRWDILAHLRDGIVTDATRCQMIQEGCLFRRLYA